jgi:hypothetical protein
MPTNCVPHTERFDIRPERPRKLQTVFCIGHLGDFNELMLAGTLAGVEMGLSVAGIPHAQGGIQAAMSYLVDPRGKEKDDRAASPEQRASKTGISK